MVSTADRSDCWLVQIVHPSRHNKTKDKHTAVKNAWKDRYVEKGYAEEGYLLDPLMLEIDQNIAGQLNIENPIQAMRIAELVMDFWHGKFNTD